MERALFLLPFFARGNEIKMNFLSSFFRLFCALVLDFFLTRFPPSSIPLLLDFLKEARSRFPSLSSQQTINFFFSL